MLSPTAWIKPRLKSLCVAFGAADMTLIILSTICWYYFFNVGFEAQHLHSLYNKQIQKKDEGDDDIDEGDLIYKLKEERTLENLRLERTIRACGIPVTNNDLDTESIDANYAGPAAMVGASMGSFFILGALLCSINTVDHPAARRVICAVALFGESVSCFFLLIGVVALLTNDGLCPTEYYYEFFQPVTYLVILTLIFISTYKAYEMTILAFYMGDQSTELNQEKKTIKRLSGGGTGSLESDLKKLKISVKEQAGQGDAEPQNETRRKSADANGNEGGEGVESRRRRRSRDGEETKRKHHTPTDNSSRDPDGEVRRRRRKSREEDVTKTTPDTATATNKRTSNSGSKDGSGSKRHSRGHSRDREEGRHGQSGEHRKSKGHGGDEESELRRKQRHMEAERLKRVEGPEGGSDRHSHERRRKHTTLKDKEKPQRDNREFNENRKQRQSEEYHRDWENETKKADRRHPAGMPKGGGEGGDGALVPV